MKLKLITFLLLSGLFVLIVFGWGKNSGLSELGTPTIYWLLTLFAAIGVFFILSVIRYQRLGKPKLRVKSCLNKHLTITGAFLAITQAVLLYYRYNGAGVNEFSGFLGYRLTVGVCMLLAFLQIYNFIRCRTFCRNGISGPGVTVLWKDVEKWRWIDRDTLYIACKNDFLLFKIKTRLKWTVPRGLRDTIETILLEKARKNE